MPSACLGVKLCPSSSLLLLLYILVPARASSTLCKAPAMRSCSALRHDTHAGLLTLGGVRRDTAKAQIIDQPNLRTPVISFLPPPSIYAAVVKMGVEKANLSWLKTFWLGVLAGFYLSFGGVLAYSVGGEMPGVKKDNPGLQKLVYGAFGLPFGLAMIVICGGELYTSNAAFMPAAIFEGRGTFMALLKNWFWSYFGNLAGSLFIVFLLDETLLFHGAAAPSGLANAMAVSVAKTSAPWGTTLVRGMMCNWLVCLGVWQATAAQDIIGKIVGIFFPIMAFVSIGFDHVIANMFLVPFGMKLGSGVSVGTYIWRSMIPVVIGNTLSAAILVALSYACMYGRYGQWLDATLDGASPWGKKKGSLPISSSATSLQQTSISEEPRSGSKV